MLTWAALIYAMGVISLDFYLIAHRSGLAAGLGPGYPIQVAVATLFTLLAFAGLWAGLRGLGRRDILGFGARLAGLTVFFYSLLAFLCPFLPNDTAIWYDPLATIAAFVWVVWWESVRAPARPALRAPSGRPSTPR